MPTVQTQIRIDKNVKTQANTIFEALGLDMSSAVNIFLHQCILHNGIPFNVEIPKSAQYKTEVLEAMAEAKKLSCDKNAKRYKTFKDALNDIDMD